jgi:hypothetical protein
MLCGKLIEMLHWQNLPTCFSMHVTDNIVVAIVAAKPLETDRQLVAVFLMRCSCLLQYMTEKMGGAEGTQMDVDFMDMERVNITAVVLA